MSNVPLMASTRPAQRRCPNPARPAATNVNIVPVTVTWLGVMCSRPISSARRWALRLTPAGKRAWNTRPLLVPSHPPHPHLLVDLDDLGGEDAPGVALGLCQPRLAQPA